MWFMGTLHHGSGFVKRKRVFLRRFFGFYLRDWIAVVYQRSTVSARCRTLDDPIEDIHLSALFTVIFMLFRHRSSGSMASWSPVVIHRRKPVMVVMAEVPLPSLNHVHDIFWLVHHQRPSPRFSSLSLHHRTPLSASQGSPSTFRK